MVVAANLLKFPLCVLSADSLVVLRVSTKNVHVVHHVGQSAATADIANDTKTEGEGTSQDKEESTADGGEHE